MFLFFKLKFGSSLFAQNRYDKANKRGFINGYFFWLTIGYGIGK